MTSASTKTVGLLALLGAVALAGALLVWRGLVSDEDRSRGTVNRPHPPLFQPERRCPGGGNGTFGQASRLEQQAHFHAERYPYDAKDGIRAVHRFQEAASCYRALGSNPAAERARQSASQLIERIEVDYASARLVLTHALDKEQWSAAHAEIRRLEALTGHLPADRYVDWLSAISGKVAAHAGATP